MKNAPSPEGNEANHRNHLNCYAGEQAITTTEYRTTSRSVETTSMWIPKDEAEILAALAAGGLHETATFEAKRELPDAARNVSLAVDVAAMSTDGGVIIYGLEEDANHFISVPAPIPLAGARERILAIVQSTITEVPKVFVNSIPTANDPNSGYVLLLVPPSARAPHMVIVRGDHRYYGRTDAGNRMLNEAEVAQLYRRRAESEADFTKTLLLEKDASPIGLDAHRGHLYLLAQPALSNSSLLDQSQASSAATRDLLTRLVDEAKDLNLAMRDLGWAPDFNYIGINQWQRALEGFRNHVDDIDPGGRIDFRFDFTGAIHLFCGRGAETLENGTKVIFSSIVAGLTARFIYMAGRFYESKGYLGSVKLGILADGIEGTQLFSMTNHGRNPHHIRFPYDSYTQSTSASALSLSSDYKELAAELVLPLTFAMSNERDNPFTPRAAR